MDSWDTPPLEFLGGLFKVLQLSDVFDANSVAEWLEGTSSKGWGAWGAGGANGVQRQGNRRYTGKM
jgi:hypothetical protein